METESLESLCELIVDCPHFTPKWTDSGIIVTRNQNIRNGKLDLTNPSYTNNENYERRIKRAKPSAGDVIFTREAPMGEICMIPEGLECCLGQRQVLLRTNKDINSKYLLFAMQSSFVRHQILWSEGTGSTVSNVRLPDLRALKIPRHKGGEDGIASVLGALDDKIENNRRMNETLEEMARTIFKSWFVDFDPVHAKAAGNAPAHMDDETAALFPSSFGDDGLPKGWKWRKLGDCVTLTKGRSYKSAELQESDTALVSLKSFLRGGGYRPDGLKAYIGTYKDEQTLNSGDLIVALTDVTQAADVIGKPAIVRSDNEFKTLVASLDVGVLRSIEPSVSIPFLYCLMMTHDFQAHIYGHTSGTTVLHLGKEGVPTYEFGMPTIEVLDKFTTIAKPIFSKIELNAGNSNTLAELRDTLLPKLMSGELRVADAEREVEGVL